MASPILVTVSDRAAISTLVLDRMRASQPVPVYAELTQHLNEATVVPAPDLPATVVRLGSRVQLSFLDTGDEQVVRLVVPGEPRVGRLSVLTPLGVALLGRRRGDTVRMETLDGPARVQIVSVDSAETQAAKPRPAPTPFGMAAVSVLFALAAMLG